MAVTLEARVPLIHHRVVEFVWRLPQAAKIRGGVSKWLLREGGYFNPAAVRRDWDYQVRGGRNREYML
jgi:asparagine synthase (glutamine-hydrolysing)